MRISQLLRWVVWGLLAGPGLTYVQAQGLKVSPLFLTFNHTLGAAQLPASQNLSLSNLTAAAVTFTAAVPVVAGWLTVSPNDGKAPATLKVSVNPTGLAMSTYTSEITLTPSAGTAVKVPVTLQVKAPPAAVTVGPVPVTFQFVKGGVSPLEQKIQITSGGQLMTFTAAVAGASWLTALPVSGVLFPAFPFDLTLRADPAALAPGTFKGTVNIATPAAATKTTAVEVNLTVEAGKPVLTALYPPGVRPAAAAVPVTLTGANFYAGTLVNARAGGAGPWTALTLTVLGPTALQVTLPVALLSSPATVEIQATNPGLAGGASDTVLSFTVYGPGPRVLGISHAATFLANSFAPGTLVNLFGLGLGPDTVQIFTPPGGGGAIATSLQGVSVTFNGVAAPLIFVSDTQLACMAPYGLTPGATIPVIVTTAAGASTAYNAPVSAAAPGLFTFGSSGTGAAAAFNVTSGGIWSLNTEANAVTRGSTLVLYGTGAGITNSYGADGSIPVIPIPPVSFTSPVAEVTLAGTALTVDYFGPAPGLVDGVFQLNVIVPADATVGKAVPVVVKIGTAESPAGVTVAVK